MYNIDELVKSLNRKRGVKMAEKRVLKATVTQQIEEKYFSNGFNSKVDAMTEIIINNFKNAGLTAKVAGIIHDKDKKIDRGRKISKPSHFHFYIELDKRTTISKIASLVGVEEQYVEFIKRGRYSVENTLAYLIHAKQPEKHQYDYTEVYCNGADELEYDYGWKNGWYHDYYLEHADEWERQLVSGNRSKRLESADVLCEKILNGELSYHDILMNKEYQAIYIEKKSKIDSAIQVYTDSRAERIKQMVDEGTMKLSTFFITGKSDAGKTFFAKKLIKRIQEKTGWSSYSGATQNGFDEYVGEDIVLLDDFRATSMNASDWLQLMDNYNINKLPARYHNKSACQRLLFVTSYKDPITFFSEIKNAINEDYINQFLRRLSMTIEIVNENEYENWYKEYSQKKIDMNTDVVQDSTVLMSATRENEIEKPNEVNQSKRMAVMYKSEKMPRAISVRIKYGRTREAEFKLEPIESMSVDEAIEVISDDIVREYQSILEIEAEEKNEK